MRTVTACRFVPASLAIFVVEQLCNAVVPNLDIFYAFEYIIRLPLAGTNVNALHAQIRNPDVDLP